MTASAKRNTDESSEVKQNAEKGTRTRERSRKGAPKRFIQHVKVSEENEEDQCGEIASLEEQTSKEIAATNKRPTRAKRQRGEKIAALLNELSQGSDNDNEDANDKEFKPTGTCLSLYFKILN